MTEQLNRAQRDKKLNELLDYNNKEINLSKAQLRDIKVSLKRLNPRENKDTRNIESLKRSYSEMRVTLKRSQLNLFRFRITALWLRIVVNFVHFIVINLFLTFGIIELGVGADMLFNLNISMYIISNRTAIRSILNGIYSILVVLGYVMSRYGIWNNSTALKWSIYLFLSNASMIVWGMWPISTPVCIFILISITNDLLILAVKNLYNVFKLAVQNSKDRLTIMVTLFGVVISLIALFNKK